MPAAASVQTRAAPVQAPAGDAPAGRLEQAFAIVSLVILAGGVFPLLQKDTSSDTGAIGLAAIVICCVVAAVLLHRRGGGILAAGTRLDVAALLLLGIIALSVFWSEQPAVTARRAAAVLLYTVFGLYLVDRFPVREQPWLLARACGIAAITSVVVAVLIPRYGVLPGHASEWRGIFVQKNVLGRVMAAGVLASVFSAFLSPARHRRRRLSGAIAVLCGAVLLRSSSVFAMVSMITVLLPVLLLLVFRSRYPTRQAFVVVLLVMGGVGAALVIGHWNSLLTAVGRDSGLTGRVQLWTSCWNALVHRPLFGYGYGGFWHGWSAPSTQVYLENPWGPPNAHNGPLDLALGIGVLGAALWLWVLLGCIWRAVRSLADQPSAEGLWLLGLPLLVVSYNITEVTTTANGLFWALLVAVSTSLCVASRERATARLWSGQQQLRLSKVPALRPA